MNKPKLSSPTPPGASATQQLGAIDARTAALMRLLAPPAETSAVAQIFERLDVQTTAILELAAALDRNTQALAAVLPILRRSPP